MQNEIRPVRAAPPPPPPPPPMSDIIKDEFQPELTRTDTESATYASTYEYEATNQWTDNGVERTGTEEYMYSNPFSAGTFDNYGEREQGNPNGSANYATYDYDNYKQNYDTQYQYDYSAYGATGNEFNNPEEFSSKSFQADPYLEARTTNENQPQNPRDEFYQDYQTNVNYDGLATTNYDNDVTNYNYGDYQTPYPNDNLSYGQTSNDFNAYNPITSANYDDNNANQKRVPNVFESEFKQQQPTSFDPFSWEEQEKKFDEPGNNIATVVPKYEPPPRPGNPPSRPERPPAPTFKPPSEKQITSNEMGVHDSESAEHKNGVHAEEEEDDAWKQFNKMNEKLNLNLQKILDKDPVGNLGKEFISDLNKTDSKLNNDGMNVVQRVTVTQNPRSNKVASEQKQMDPDPFNDKDAAAIELAKRIAASQMVFDWKAPDERESSGKQQNIGSSKEVNESISGPLIADAKEDTQIEIPIEIDKVESDGSKVEEAGNTWTTTFDFEKAQLLPPSESDLLLVAKLKQDTSEVDEHKQVASAIDPFIPVDIAATTTEEVYDPFDVKIEDIIAATKKQIELEKNREENDEFSNVDADLRVEKLSLSSPVTEAGSVQHPGFNDDFDPNCSLDEPLYDDDDTQPLKEFIESPTGDGWDLMIRYPFKKKLMNDRYWKPCFVRIHENIILMFNNHEEEKPFHKLSILATYSLSDITLQPYDAFGKIHTVKFQHVMYKERLGIRPGQISKIMEGQINRYGKPIEHAAQVTVLAKFGSLNYNNFITFIATIEDMLFRSPLSRDTIPQYKQEEIQIHCYDEYEANVDKDGIILDQKARVRIFCLAFVGGSPFLEIGLNDRRREGKEIVRRKDILPLYTERWIKIENPEFRNELVDANEWAENQLVKIKPPDGCFFEIMRFRIRPPRNREKPLIIKSTMTINRSKIEIEIEAMAAAQQHKSKGTIDSTRLIPCEDICIRFPIPEEWIYIFREERHWGVGSVHSKTRKAGKMKNLRDRLVGAVQQMDHTLIEVGIGEAKYEHLFRALVWRIPRLPEKESTSYKPYKLKCSFELSSFDLVPEAFARECHVDFTMPLATISNTVVRSVSVEQHEDSDRIEKFVRYLSKCHYLLEVDYLNSATDSEYTENPPVSDPTEPQLEEKTCEMPTVPENPNDDSYFFGHSEGVGRRSDSTSSDEEGTHAKSQIPVISINMKGYGY